MSGAAGNALRFGTGDAAFDGGGNPVHRVVDLDEAFGAILEGQIGQIDIDRDVEQGGDLPATRNADDNPGHCRMRAITAMKI